MKITTETQTCLADPPSPEFLFLQELRLSLKDRFSKKAHIFPSNFKNFDVEMCFNSELFISSMPKQTLETFGTNNQSCLEASEHISVQIYSIFEPQNAKLLWFEFPKNTFLWKVICF